MPWSDMAMLMADENCWRTEPAESAVAAKAKLGSFSIKSTLPPNPGSAAR